MAKNHALGVDENDIEELLEVVTEEPTNELLKLEQEHKAEEANAKDTAEESAVPPPCHKKKIREGFSRTFWETSRSSLKSLKAWTPTSKGFN